MSNNNNSNSQEERLTHLTISEKQKAIMVRSVFAIDTGDIIISLKPKYESTKIIFTVDKNKWQKNHKAMKEIARENGVNDKEDINLLISHLDDNWQTIVSKIRETEEEKSKISKISQADVLLGLFNEKSQYMLFKDEFNVPHALVDYEPLPIEGTKFRRYLSKLYLDNIQRVPSSEAVKNVIQQLEAKAFFEGKTINLHLRTSWSNNQTKDTIYYDLTDSKNRYVKITADDWKIVDNQIEVLFRKYNNLSPQVKPMVLNSKDIMDGKILDRLISLFNVKGDDNKLLLKCYIISLFIPDIPKPILLLHGEQGGAKSTLMELIKMLIDPSSTKTLTFPKDAYEFIQQLSHNYIVYYDNISHIKDWISDLLCRAATGSSFSKRALFTNDDDFYYNFKRNIGINGIDIAATKADLLDRSIIIRIDRIDKKERIKIEKIWEDFNRIKPQVLGYIFNILSKVLKYRSEHEKIDFPNGLSRMADWEEYAEIISRCMGNEEGEFQRVYQENIGVIVDEAIASSPLSMAILEFMSDKQESIEIPTELYSKLNEIAETKLKINTSKIREWPKSASHLSRRINGIKTNLREKGIDITLNKKDGKRIVTILKVASKPSKPSNNSNSSTNQSLNLDGISNDGRVPSKVPSSENLQNQAQNTILDSMDGKDDILQTYENKDKKIITKQAEEEQEESEYRMKFGSDIKSEPYPISKELYDSLNGNKELRQVLPEDIEWLETENEAELKYEDDDYDENDYYSNNNEDED